MQTGDVSSEPPTKPMAEAIRPVLRKQAGRSGENFSVLSPLLPRDLVDDFAAVYAFCRRADDMADSVEPTPEGRAAALENLASLRTALDRWLDAESDVAPDGQSAWHPEDAMLARLAEVVRSRSLKREHFHRLLDAFERDQHQTRYQTWDDLLSYCEDSANPVGRLVLELGGLETASEEHADLVGHADRICTALQLTNHWQDVRRDLLERDRVYLPSEETGLSEEDLHRMIQNPKNPELRIRYIRSLRPLVMRTQQLYLEAKPIFHQLKTTPADRLTPTVRLLAAGGFATLRKVDRTGCTTLWKRPRLSTLDKGMLICSGALSKLFGR